jgi:DNA-binding transcriptional regulator GbsR (MarR family)
MDDELARFVEEAALFWEEQGLPRIAGRILAWLLVCDPPYRSARQLTEELGASKASISTMTRLLQASGTIEVVAIPGERATHFRLTPHTLGRKLERRLQAMVSFLPLARRGLELLADEPPERRERLEEVASMYAFLARELPALLERWRAERDHG